MGQCTVGLRQDPMGLSQHDLTCSGQGDFAFTSVEELGADIFFDPLDRLTQRRLRHVERSAARRKFSSSATATNWRICRRSIIV